MLGDLTSIQRGHEMAVVSHYNIRRVIDIYGAVQDRDLGAVAKDVERIVHRHEKGLPRGMFISLRGQVQTMRGSYLSLLGGLGFAIVLVYMLIVVNFQSWLDPFIIITGLPAALAGIVLFLFLTHTTLSVPALMGAIMCMGVATANSILVVSFAKSRLAEHGDAILAAIEAGRDAFSPRVHDGAGDDHRHGADGAWIGRRWRTECAAGTRCDWGPALRHCSHPGFRSRGVFDAAWRRRRGHHCPARA